MIAGPTSARRPAAPLGVIEAAAAPRPPAPGCAGQASVELVALLPLAAVVAAAVFCLLSAGAARETAASAAQAGAMALIQGGDARAAAHDAVGDRRAAIIVRGGRVTVEVRPRLPLPGLARLLTARDSADAGRGVVPAPPAGPVRRGGDGEATDR